MKKILMSKGMGKVLDNKFVKKVMVPVGNVAIKVLKGPGNMVVEAMKKEEMMAKKKDAYYRAHAPVGAEGGTNKGEYRSSSFRYGIQKRKIT